MLNPIPTSDCEAAREAASARLDGELAQLDEARLEAHLRDCAPCAEYIRDVEAIAHQLRTAPLEQPELSFALPRRRVHDVRLVAAAAVALVALAAGSSVAVGHVFGGGSSPAATAATVQANQSNQFDQHLLAMLRRVEGPRTLRVGPLIML